MSQRYGDFTRIRKQGFLLPSPLLGEGLEVRGSLAWRVQKLPVKMA